MKKKLRMMIPSVAATLAAVAFVVHTRTSEVGDDADMKAALGGGASLESGPVPTVTSYDLSSHQTLSRVILLIRENYVEPERIRPYEMFLAALDYIQKTVPEVVVDDTQAPERITMAVGAAEQSFDLGGVDQLWEVTMSLREIFQFLQTQLTDPEQRREIEYAAINGMLSTLDPHSVLLKPESFDEVKLSTKGEFGGLGIVISIRDGALTIISPIEGTPASRAGIKPKDKITKIGEESTVNMTLEEAVQRLRGRPGTKVSLWLLRKGWPEQRRYTLTRANIKIESVASELLADAVGYVKIKSFQNNTYDDLHDHLERLRKKNKGELKGLVLDLRNNPGGLLDQAILVSDRFVDKGPLVITVGEGNRKREEKNAHFSGTERDYPIVALVNGGSASASEIVAGALKNHDRAVVIGQQTFGKGSVQVLYDFKDKSALKLTIAQYLTPGDISIQSVGILPDVVVTPAVVNKERIHLFVDDDSPREKDLEKHLDRRQPEPGELAAASASSFIKMVHLTADPDPAAGTATDEAVDEAAEKFEYDFETRLAHDLLVQAPNTDRKALLEHGAALFRARTEDEGRRIEERMRQLGIDWSPPTPNEVTVAGEAGAQAELTITGKTKGPLRGGETAKVTAVVRNTGNVTLYRVYGVSSADNPLLDNLEFAFGKLPPGAARSWSVEVKLPEDLMARADAVKLELGDEAHRLTAASASTLVTFEEVAKPRFAYSVQLDDRQGGNGDGVLQPGEKVDVAVQVTNLGPGEAKEAVVSLRNLAGETVFLERGREKIGLLQPGTTRSTSLKFSLRGDAELDTARFRLTIWDGYLGSSMSESLSVPVLQPRHGDPEVCMLKAAGTDEVAVYAGATTSAEILGWLKPGLLARSDVRLNAEAIGAAKPDASGHGEARLEAWRRIEIPPGVFGFVRETQVKTVRAALRPTAKQAVRLRQAQAAPLVDLALPGLATSADALHLKGMVSDARGLKDVFIFVNDKKLFYRALGDVKPTGDHVQAPFDVTLPLKKGANTVTVVAREGEDLMTRRVFGVYRGEADVIADAQREVLPAAASQ